MTKRTWCHLDTAGQLHTWTHVCDSMHKHVSKQTKFQRDGDEQKAIQLAEELLLIDNYRKEEGQSFCKLTIVVGNLTFRLQPYLMRG